MNQDRTQKIIIAVLALLLVVVSGALVRQIYFSNQHTPVTVVTTPGNNLNINDLDKNINSPDNNNNQPNSDNTPNIGYAPDKIGISSNNIPSINEKDGSVIFTGKSNIDKVTSVRIATINGTACLGLHCNFEFKPGESWWMSAPIFLFANGKNLVEFWLDDLNNGSARATSIVYNLTLPNSEVVAVKWLMKPKNDSTATVLKYLDAPQINQDGAISPTYSQVGTVTADQIDFANDKIYRFANTDSMEYGPGGYYSTLAIASPADNKLIVIARYSNMLMNGTDIPSVFAPLTIPYVIDKNIFINDLEAPPYLQLKNNITITRATTAIGAPMINKDLKIIGQAADGTNIYQGSGGLPAVLLKDGELITYNLTIPFFTNNRIPAITWNDGTVNDSDYNYVFTGGCGAGTSWQIAPSDLKTNLLVPAGKTSNGDTVYISNDPTNAHDLYDSWSTWGGGVGKSYEEFLKLKPTFYWQDPFSRWIVWNRADLLPMAECGKPVVYLYPTQAEQVSVKLGSNINVTKSEPEYGKGWTVTAEPNGTLTTADGKTYSNLYWDGNGASYDAPTTGFVVARNNVEATFKSKLAQLGLNAKEISDFSDFWLPIVTKSPYALISFVPQDEWSKAAPLSISPAPETVIRVFMDWKPLASPISVAPQILPPTPTRTGFTAVEWGGLLYK